MQNNTFFEDYDPNNVIVIEEVSSTNDYLKQLLSNSKPLAPFTVIMAKRQTAGRGQRGNIWVSEPLKNITCSILLCPSNLTVQQQFFLTVAVSLAVYDALNTYCPAEYAIKWPNDIYIKNKKVSGILIENKIAGSHIKHSIVGLGINIYQTVFPDILLHKVTSLALENPNVNVDLLPIVTDVTNNMIKYLQLIETDPSHALCQYNERLYQKDLLADYMFKNKQVKGTIRCVEEDGLLQIEVNGTLHKVGLKEIVYL